MVTTELQLVIVLEMYTHTHTHTHKVPGVGRVTERVLDALDVKTCGDIHVRYRK